MSEATAQVSTTTAALPAEIWKALTTPEKLKQYFFGANVQSDWKVGSPIRMKGYYRGRSYEDRGEIIALEPNKRLSFSHWSPLSGAPDTPENYHVVTFELSPHGADTTVTLTQANLTGGVTASDIEHRADYEKNWRTVLDGLTKVLAH